MMSRISPEDQTLLKSLMDARRSGDTKTVTRIEAELQAKYPDMHF